SALSRMSYPLASLNWREVKSGVCLMCSAMRARASRKSASVRTNGAAAVCVTVSLGSASGGWASGVGRLQEIADDAVRRIRIVPLYNVRRTGDDGVLRTGRHLRLALHGRRIGLVE